MTTRQNLIQCIQSTNRCLTQDHLEQQDNIALLRNVHPLYRGDYAKKLYDERQITKQEKGLFVKLY